MKIQKLFFYFIFLFSCFNTTQEIGERSIIYLNKEEKDFVLKEMRELF